MNEAGIRRVITVATVLAAVPGLPSLALGAWPIVALLAVGVILLYWALSISLRDGDAFEVVTLWPDHLDVRCVSPKGRETIHSFNPFFSRLVVERDHDDRITAVRIMAPERQLEVGRFLNAADKARFVKMFGPELARAKR